MQVLLVDDDQDSRSAVKWFLIDQGHKVTECTSGAEALAKYLPDDFPLVLSDIKMPGMSGIELLTAIKKIPGSWRSDVVLFTGYADTGSAIAALREGAYDYLIKPVNAHELVILVDRIAEHQNLLRENKALTERFFAEVDAATEETKRELNQIKQLVTESAVEQIGVFSEASEAVLKLALKFHQDPSIPVLIEGETGTGKEIVAKTIHFGDGKDIINDSSPRCSS